jgi:hypothetical protein
MPKKAQPTRTTNPLPFADLDPHRFEDLARNLIYDFRRWKSIEATGKAGNDDGFDVRAWEETSDISNFDQQDDELSIHPMEGNLWKIQCKREKQLGPTRVKAIINEGVDEKEPPYGYILVAPTTFSKRSYDVFRNELRAKGVMEFHLWGKSELEDMLFLPKNDNILFAFFGISLVTRRRSRTTEIRFAISNKNKLFKILSNGYPNQEFRKPILARDSKDSHYPWETNYKDFERAPRWKEYTAIAFHPVGLVVEVAKHFAFLDAKVKEWDFVDTIDLLHRQGDDNAKRKDDYEKQNRVRNCWKYMPRANQAYFIVNGLIFFEDILAIDSEGDSLFLFPHIFADFRAKFGPVKGLMHSLKIGHREIYLNDEYKRVSCFPKVFPVLQKGRVYKDRAVEVDEDSARRITSGNGVQNIFDVGGTYAFLKQRDLIRVAGVRPSILGDETFIEITHKYEMPARDYMKEHPEHVSLVEKQIGRTLNEQDCVTIFEFETVPSWKLKDE